MFGWVRRIIGDTADERRTRIEPELPRPAPAAATPRDGRRTAAVPAAPAAQSAPSPAAVTRPAAARPPASEPALSPPSGSSAWFGGLSGKVLFFDVETTGLREDDRVVSLGMLLLDPSACRGTKLAFSGLHLVFDPGRPSHPRAEQVHGYDDWTLRHQADFRDSAEAVRDLVAQSSLLVAHNLAFDIAFLERELAAACVPLPGRPGYCTMQAWRREKGGSAGLGAILGQWGLSRAGSRHGALEDAWFAFLVWAHLNHAVPPQPFGLEHLRRPTNFREPPPRPAGPLPRRRASGR